MNDLERRLAVLDPAAAEPYHHPDLDGLVTRITRQPRRSQTGWRDFRVKVAAALVASSLVTAGAIAALEGAVTTLPVLAIAGTAHHPGTSFSAEAAPMGMAPSATHYVAGPRLATSATAGLVAELRHPPNAQRSALRLASAFGITHAHERRLDKGWLVTSRSGATLDLQSGLVSQWYYSSTSPAVAPATKSSTATGVPSHATLERIVMRFLTRLGFGYGVTAPTFSDATVSGLHGSTPTTTAEETETATVTVHGLATNQSVTFTVDRHRTVLYAAGPDLAVADTYHYPLRSVAAGVKALNPGPGTSAQRTLILTSWTTELRPFRLRDGSTWLLPVYRYHESEAAARTTWLVLAVDPGYLRIPTSAKGVTPRGALGP